METDPVYVDAWGSLLRVHAEVVSRIEGALEDSRKISLIWYDVLLVLDNSPEKRLRMSEIATGIVLSRSALSRSVAKLEKEGYVKRESCSEDERGAYAVLTKKGQDALKAARPIYWAEIKKHFASGLSDGETKALAKIMEKIAGNCANADQNGGKAG